MYILHTYWLIWVNLESLYVMPQCNCDCCENQQNDIHLYRKSYMKFTCIFHIFAQIWYRIRSQQFLEQLQDLWIWCSESHASLSDISAYICTFHILWLSWMICGLRNQHTMLLKICEFHENQSRQDCTYRHKLNSTYMCNIKLYNFWKWSSLCTVSNSTPLQSSLHWTLAWGR
jgi:hypothetical protein